MKFLKISSTQVNKYFFAIFILGILARSYGINDHWKRNDHYNFGGAMMTHSLKCLRTAPIEITRGLVTTDCDTDKPNVYVNYTPFFLYGIWLTTEVFGPSEWAHRLFFLIFSALNILLVFLIAKRIWQNHPRIWIIAAFFQAFFLSPMYLGTHMDPITEFTLTPMLLSTYFILKDRMLAACVFALIAGLTTWIGYFQFFPVLLYAWAKRKNFPMVIGFCFSSFVVCFGSLMFLRDSWDILGFVNQKLTNPEYIRPSSFMEKILLPLEFVRNFFQSQGRLLSPLFATLGLYELFFGRGKGIWTYKRINLRALPLDQWAIILTGLPLVMYLIPGFKYAMVHIHNYIFLVPMWALLCAFFVEQMLLGLRPWGKILTILLVAFVASYPYGIYQSHLIHDVVNSILFVGSALGFLIFLRKKPIHRSVLVAFLLISALANVSQVINYRNESDTDFEFCEEAKREYAQTGKPVHTKEPRTRTKVYLYCRGIPIVYEGPEQGI